jgi:hypothetical protein
MDSEGCFWSSDHSDRSTNAVNIFLAVTLTGK